MAVLETRTSPRQGNQLLNLQHFQSPWDCGSNQSPLQARLLSRSSCSPSPGQVETPLTYHQPSSCVYSDLLSAISRIFPYFQQLILQIISLVGCFLEVEELQAKTKESATSYSFTGFMCDCLNPVITVPSYHNIIDISLTLEVTC